MSEQPGQFTGPRRSPRSVLKGGQQSARLAGRDQLGNQGRLGWAVEEVESAPLGCLPGSALQAGSGWPLRTRAFMTAREACASETSAGAGYAAPELVVVGLDHSVSLGCGNRSGWPGSTRVVVLYLSSVGCLADKLLSARRVSPGRRRLRSAQGRQKATADHRELKAGQRASSRATGMVEASKAHVRCRLSSDGRR